MRLYHGTNILFDTPDLAVAKRMAERTAECFG